MFTFRSLRAVLALGLSALLAACGGAGGGSAPSGTPPTPVSGGAGQIVHLWVSAYQDAYVHCSYDNQAVSHTQNYGTSFDLRVQNDAFGESRTYVQFDYPELPEGTVVEEAYFELYHAGAREDGQTDDISLYAVRPQQAWDSATINYGNQPIPGGAVSNEFRMRLNSQDWSGSQNIAPLVVPQIFDPATNNGFMVYWPFGQSPRINKGFYSLNNFRQTFAPAIAGMSFAPRMLLRVRLPAGTSVNDIGGVMEHPFDVYNDLGRLARPPRAIAFVGSQFPTNWQVKRGGP